MSFPADWPGEIILVLKKGNSWLKSYSVKVDFSQKEMAKFSNLSNCHSCEPKIVPVLLIPLNDYNKILANL